MGDDFPDVMLVSPGDSHRAAYLGVEKGKGFIVSDLKSDVVLVEVMNVNCHSFGPPNKSDVSHSKTKHSQIKCFGGTIY